MRAVQLAAGAGLALAAVACGGPKVPDYQSIWTTSSTPTTTTATTRPVPFAQYLQGIGVSGEQVDPRTLPDLTVSIPTPPGWENRTNPNIKPETEIIAKGGELPTAMLVVFKLRGDFDAAEAVKHGYDDAELSQNFRRLDASTAAFHGFPSAMIQGSYDLDGRRLHTWSRIVIATGSPPAKQRYLVQLSITTLADQAFAQAADVEEIIRGFTVAAK
ncbi:MAG: LpqN/LpqT family lipoprotein [Mycobacterium sp.]|uniref:LpqN/LpqT family lipoprotein n=1 Tax=Mycobacterium sp. TaxID=1785 RepID=UPI00262BA561|nr:LpqN/LpqT family lipoprotein [Mycobacterium sp.]MDI3314960.1 LpqN/LpqT family lipoprotein [Mycobacterium sp.]